MTQNEGPATRDQVVALMALYSQWEKHALPEGADPRAARLAWASEHTGREVSSFSNLSLDEARNLIDMLKGSLGQPLGEKPRPWRRVYSRDRAQAAGRAGRRGDASSLIQLASPEDLARVDELLRRLDWTQEQFNAWLRSPRSPVGSKDQFAIRTAAQANRIYWALKAMLVRAGRWQPAPRKKAPLSAVKAGAPAGVCASKG
jgi:hypothetical protein